MFTPHVKRRRITPGTKQFPRAGGFTVVRVDEAAGEVLAIRSRDLHAYATACRIPVDEAISKLLRERVQAAS